MKKIFEIFNETYNKAFVAGMLITIAAIAKLQITNPYVGAFVFSVALFFICSMKLKLFTGLVGFYELKKYKTIELLFSWLGNFVGCCISTCLLHFFVTSNDIHKKAESVLMSKINMNFGAGIGSAFFCGVLMFLAVYGFKILKSDLMKVFSVVMCVMAFLLIGFDHSIATMAYFWMGVSNNYEFGRGLLVILLFSIFNGLGSLSIRGLICGNQSTDSEDSIAARRKW